MPTEKQTYRLVAMYCRPLLAISAAGTLSVAGTLVMVGSSALASTFCITSMLKAALTAISVLLLRSMRQKSEDYFYINLGQHPKKLLGLALCADAAAYIIACSLILFVRYVSNL